MKLQFTQYRLLITILLIVVVFGMGGNGYAQDVAQCVQGSVSDTSYMTSLFTHVMAWAWSIPAILAGELMSNDLIYGQIIGLEHYFYQFWLLMRTIANFAIVAIVVYVIGKIALGGLKPREALTKYGFKILISGVLINMSWFAMGALVDISTVMIAGVGQMTNAFMNQTVGDSQQSTDIKRLDKIATGIPGKITIDSCGCIVGNIDTKDGARTWKDLVDKRNNVTGPLIFLGAGVMKLQSYSMNVGCGSKTLGDAGKLTLKAITQIMLMVMFIIPLLVLAAYNLFRLIYIWGWIIFSPLIILYNLFGESVGVKSSGGLDNAISFGNIISGLLQPVATVGALGIGMMLIVGLYSSMDYSRTDQLDAIRSAQIFTNAEDGSSMNIDELGSITIIDKVIEDPSGTIGGGFGYLLVAFATCFVMWMLVKMSFSLSKNTFSGVGFDPQKMMGEMTQFAGRNIKVPNLGLGTPLEGASLNEAIKFMNPETNQIAKTMNDYMKDKATEQGTRATNNIEAAFPFLQKNGKLTSDETKSAEGFGTKVKYEDNPDTRASSTKDMFDVINKSAENSDKSTFSPNRVGTNTYDVLKKWYEKGGRDSFNKLNLKADDNNKDEKPIELDKDFEKEMSKQGYLGAYINALRSMEKIEIKDGKLKIEKSNIIGKQSIGKEINFK